MPLFVDQKILYSTLRVRSREGTGTGFLVEIGDIVFLFTAAHCVRQLRKGDNVLVSHEDKWKQLPISNIGFDSSGHDAAVIRTNFDVAGRLTPLDFCINSLQGQEFAYCGFPLGLEMFDSSDTYLFPLAFVRHGILSGWWEDERGAQNFLLDSYGNFGFSGGPVVGIDGQNQRKIFGVISGGFFEKPHASFVKKGEKFVSSDDIYTRQHSGFTRFLSIELFEKISDSMIHGNHSPEPVIISGA